MDTNFESNCSCCCSSQCESFVEECKPSSNNCILSSRSILYTSSSMSSSHKKCIKRRFLKPLTFIENAQKSGFITNNELKQIFQLEHQEKGLQRLRSYQKKLHAEKLQQISKLNKFAAEKHEPSWYRELSDKQMKAADSILNRIRDDTEEDTGHRILESLLDLGLYPLQSTANIKLVLKISNGSDLAFLWFLRELFYRKKDRTDPPLEYTINEQLILSAICHLDMVTTLRELDERIERPQLIHKNRLKEPLACKRPTNKIKNEKVNTSPYLQKLTRPKPILDLELCSIPSPKQNFSPYNVYQDKTFIVANESKRWFSEDFSVQTIPNELSSVLIVKDLLNQAIENIFDENFIEESVKRTKKRELRKRIFKEINSQTTKSNEKFNQLAFFSTDPKEVRDYQFLYKNLSETAFDFGHDGCSPRSSQIYFQHQQKHKPYKFNYQKIFNDDCALNRYTDNVRDRINEALGINNSSQSIDNISSYLNSLWQKQVDEFNLKSEELIKSSQESVQNTKKKSCNPRKEKDVENLLADIFEEMCKNRKFILASLPNAHKLPILKEWVKQRFGLQYSKKNREDRLEITLKILGKVSRLQRLDFNVPKVDDISKKKRVPYACIDSLQTRKNKVIKNHHQNIKLKALQLSRKVWPLMEPFHCTAGPPRKTFYAYMPSAPYDVLPFRPWQNFEYTDAHFEWKKRMARKKLEEETKI